MVALGRGTIRTAGTGKLTPLVTVTQVTQTTGCTALNNHSTVLDLPVMQPHEVSQAIDGEGLLPLERADSSNLILETRVFRDIRIERLDRVSGMVEQLVTTPWCGWCHGWTRRAKKS
jgi:hypothetical protein